MARTKQTARHAATVATKSSRAGGGGAVPTKASRKSGAGAEEGIRKKRRFRPGTKARREIKKMQQTYTLLSAKARIRRIARAEIERVMTSFGLSSVSIEPRVLDVLCEQVEPEMVKLLTKAGVIAHSTKKKMLFAKHIRLAQVLDNITDGSLTTAVRAK
jgi:histone H3/H4